MFRDFQPSIAAVIALFAAGLAYKAAMARVYYDRRTADFNRLNDRLALHLRLQAYLERVGETAEALAIHMAFGNLTTTQFASDMKIWPPNLPEIDEAWSKLDAIPREAVRHLAQIRDAHDDLSKFGDEPPDDRFDADRPKLVSELCLKVAKAIDFIRPLVVKEIAAIEGERTAHLSSSGR
jgi:hypothetical protein